MARFCSRKPWGCASRCPQGDLPLQSRCAGSRGLTAAKGWGCTCQLASGGCLLHNGRGEVMFLWMLTLLPPCSRSAKCLPVTGLPSPFLGALHLGKFLSLVGTYSGRRLLLTSRVGKAMSRNAAGWTSHRAESNPANPALVCCADHFTQGPRPMVPCTHDPCICRGVLLHDSWQCVTMFGTTVE